MTIREIRLFPDPVLRRKCRTVRRIDVGVRTLARDMVETLVDAEGVGLAANQVGDLRRVIAIHLPEEDPFWLVNPEIIKRDGEREVDEGCLSVPGYVGLVRRSVSITARALDAQGSKWRVSAEDLLAQALEHEIDHLDGIMFMDHLLEHEKLREIGAEPEEGETHLHDVAYDIEVHDHDSHHGHRHNGGDGEGSELVQARVRLSDVTPRHRMSDLAYDIEAGTNGLESGSDSDD